MSSAPRPRVLLLFGGRSSEHAVSCVTAAGVMRAIDRDKYDVVPVGITRTGTWTLLEGDTDSFRLDQGQVPEILDSGTHVRLGSAGTDQAHDAVASRGLGDAVGLGSVDVVFPLLHGPYGEDGTLQGMLELADIAYVGSGVAASAMGMDKHYMKVVFESAGLTVGPYEVITDKQWLNAPEEALARCERLVRPLFVKPSRAGSSVGITRVDVDGDLRAAVEAARIHDPKVVVEQGISGREIECGVLEGRGATPTRSSLPGEIVVQPGDHGFYDFEAKYVDGAAAKTSCPADLTPEQTQTLREQAVVAFDALGGEGLSRVDFFLTPEGEWVINEINTMPGFTPSSMYPQMWAASGIEYAELIDELVQLALHRKRGLR